MSAPSPRVLVIDHDRSTRLLIAKSLSAQRLVCDVAGDGESAARRLDSTIYDIVIVEVPVRALLGHALVRSDRRHRRSRLLIGTGTGDPQLSCDPKGCGFAAFFKKPLDFASLGRKVRRLWEASRTGGATSEQSPQNVSVRPILEADRPRMMYVAVLLTSAARASAIAQGLAGDWISVLAADSTDSLWRFAESSPLDLLLIEEGQYGFVSAAEILARLQQLPSVPQSIVLSAPNSRRTDLDGCGKVRRVFAAGTSDSDLVQAVRSALLDVQRSTALPAEARAVVRSFGEPLPSPGALLRMVRYLQLPAVEISIPELAQEIMADPLMAAELLRLANASSRGPRRPITEIGDALCFLGPAPAVSLLLSIGVRNLQRKPLERLKADFRAWYQLRTVLIASVSSVFAEEHYGLSGETAFVLGLFQDMGILVLANAFAERYVSIVEHVRSTGPVRLHAIERQYFHVDHADVSAALVEHWRLPDSLLEPIRHHHDPTVRVADSHSGTMAYVPPMRIAEAFADLWDNRHPARKDAISTLLAMCPRGRQGSIRDTAAAGVRKAGEVARLFPVTAPEVTAGQAICDELMTAYVEFCNQSSADRSARAAAQAE